MDSISFTTNPVRAELVTKPTTRTNPEQNNQTQIGTPGTAIDVKARQVPGVKPEQDEVETQLPPSQQSSWREAEVTRAQRQIASNSTIPTPQSTLTSVKPKDPESQLNSETNAAFAGKQDRAASVNEPIKANVQRVQQMQAQTAGMGSAPSPEIKADVRPSSVNASIRSAQPEGPQELIREPGRADRAASITEPTKAQLQRIQQMQEQISGMDQKPPSPQVDRDLRPSPVESNIQSVRPDDPERRITSRHALPPEFPEVNQQKSEPERVQELIDITKIFTIPPELARIDAPPLPPSVESSLRKVEPADPQALLDSQDSMATSAKPAAAPNSIESYNPGPIDRSTLTLEQDRQLTMSLVEQRQESERINYVNELQGVSSGITTMQATLNGLL